MVINMLIISKLQYIIKIIPIHKKFITKIAREIYTYLWETYHLELLSRKTAQLNKLQGGLSIISLETLDKADRISHFTDYRKNTYSPWQSLYSYFYGISLRDKIIQDFSKSHSVYNSDEITGNIQQINILWESLRTLDTQDLKMGKIMSILKEQCNHVPSIKWSLGVLSRWVMRSYFSYLKGK